jgi:hypothetical protein
VTHCVGSLYSKQRAQRGGRSSVAAGAGPTDGHHGPRLSVGADWRSLSESLAERFTRSCDPDLNKIFPRTTMSIGQIMNQPISQTPTSAPILRRFSLVGMNGYKTVALQCRSRVKVVAGENGVGKTSLLNSLYAVLAGKPSVLYKIDFERLEIEWQSGESFQSNKAELFPKLDEAKLRKSTAIDFFTGHGVTVDDTIELLQHYIVGDDDAISATSAYQTIYQDSPYDKDDIYGFCKRAVEGMTQASRFDELYQQVKQQIGDISVLYLPTYRRIEADLFEFRTRPRAGPRRPRSSKDGWDSDRLIFFGLEDVENKLK